MKIKVYMYLIVKMSNYGIGMVGRLKMLTNNSWIKNGSKSTYKTISCFGAFLQCLSLNDITKLASNTVKLTTFIELIIESTFVMVVIWGWLWARYFIRPMKENIFARRSRAQMIILPARRSRANEKCVAHERSEGA